MTIWIDFINTPQVSFFLPFIRDFEQKGHRLLLTCRDSGNTVAMLEHANLDFDVIGGGAKRSTLAKFLYFPIRLAQLLAFVSRNPPDIAIGQSSFYMPLVARLLRVPSLYTNDNEHALGNLLGFLFSDAICLPEILTNTNFLNHRWLSSSKVSFYPSVKEAIYLSQVPFEVTNQNINPERIYFRPEPATAQYYDGPNDFFDDVLKELSTQHIVVVLPRDKAQIRHYQSFETEQLKVAVQPIPLSQIVADCLLFIGAGGSMNRELAVYGVPVVSIYQEELLAVDQYLIDTGRIIMKSNPTADDLLEILQDNRSRTIAKKLLADGRRSYQMIHKKINQLKHA